MRFFAWIIVHCISLILCFTFSLKADDNANDQHGNLAVCTIFKNCTPYLKEWIEYHRLVGVDHFYVFDNTSEDNPLDVLNDYISNGIVTLIDWPNREEDRWHDQVWAWVYTTQLPSYHHGCALALGKYRWLAFIDTDEFLVPMQTSTLTEFLALHDHAPGVCLKWVIYGTSNVYEIPPKRLMIELLTLRAPLNHPLKKHTKSIVKPEQYAGWFWGPHVCYYLNGSSADEIPMEEARVNHYINRTVEFLYTHKLKNKSVMDNVKYSEDYILGYLNLGNDELDLTMERFIPELRQRMNFNDESE